MFFGMIIGHNGSCHLSICSRFHQHGIAGRGDVVCNLCLLYLRLIIALLGCIDDGIDIGSDAGHTVVVQIRRSDYRLIPTRTFLPFFT